MRALSKYGFWQKLKDRRNLTGFNLEITARCNNNCRHCYINLPLRDLQAKQKELKLGKLKKIIDEALSLGAIWCLLTGGEPLVRDDFFDIYIYLKKKGILPLVFTNATLINQRHIRLFKEYPPQFVDVTVYGVTEDTYERVTRVRGSFAHFRRGLDLLLANKVPMRLKTIALRSNINEISEIRKFCRGISSEYPFRFDPFLILRYDADRSRNEEIRSEKITAEEITLLERSDRQRSAVLVQKCDAYLNSHPGHQNCNHLFLCSLGSSQCTISYDGFFRPCSVLWHPDCIFDLKKGSLSEAWNQFVPKIKEIRTDREELLQKCHACSMTSLCEWCPGRAYLETGQLDAFVPAYCEVTHRRREMMLELTARHTASRKAPQASG